MDECQFGAIGVRKRRKPGQTCYEKKILSLEDEPFEDSPASQTMQDLAVAL
jgi:hypothetical protein